ncbi:MAG TPA: hypothetical protein VF622_04715 [Segetibacter sp.]|jgi:hypothetical protein
MKVICIDAKTREGDKDSPSGWTVKEGEAYTVRGVFESEDDLMCYALEEDPDNDEWGFEVNRFIPLSEIDEMEYYQEHQKEYA